uniref:NAM protein n=1 Tax=Oryza sativa subsp. japonica TaxID=39947 RepID=C6F1L5_ORYSJ|nr:NAM protein [Oryza sativa Japonica Group]
MAMQLSLPVLPTGFRFHPTDEELVINYLQRRATGLSCPIPIIADVEIYNFNPWELPSMALFGEHEWYFFTLRDHRYPNSVRPSRSAASGFWKATGTDKPVQVANMQSTPVAMKKALVFYVGRPPMETKTTWIMHEYRLTNTGGSTASHPSLSSSTAHPSVKLDEWVLCKIFNKSPEPDNTAPPSNVVSRLQCSPPLPPPAAPPGNYPPLPVGATNDGGVFACAGDMLFTIQEHQEGTPSMLPPIPNLEPPAATIGNSSLNGTAAAAAAADGHGRLEEEDTSAYTFTDQEMEQMLMDLMDQDFFGNDQPQE